MPYKIPIEPALTDTQAQLTAKLGAMKSLLALPSLSQNNLPKNQQLSVYNYCLKVFKAIGAVSYTHLTLPTIYSV